MHHGIPKYIFTRPVGEEVGPAEGALVVGRALGSIDGLSDGLIVGRLVGLGVGDFVMGANVVGLGVGCLLGAFVVGGDAVGAYVGTSVGGPPPPLFGGGVGLGGDGGNAVLGEDEVGSVMHCSATHRQSMSKSHCSSLRSSQGRDMQPCVDTSQRHRGLFLHRPKFSPSQV